MEIQEMIEVLSNVKSNEKGECVNVDCRCRLTAHGTKGEWHTCKNPEWDFCTTDYRIKPEPKRVALTMQDLIDRELSGKTMRVKHGIACMLIQDFNDEFVFFSDDEFSYEQLTSLEWIDGTPCYKEVECE